MYETIYIEKNKSSRFGVFFYKNSSEWNIFLDVCGVENDKIAVIYHENITNESWKAFAEGIKKEDALALSNNYRENIDALRNFLDKKTTEYTFVILSEPAVLNILREVIDVKDTTLSYICVPVTPFAQFDGFTILPKINEDGEVICKELFPIGVYVDISILSDATPVEFQSAIAGAFRLSISYKASMFEWMISNMYELMDSEEDAIFELLKRGYNVYKERIEKDTARERGIAVYAGDFYKFLFEMSSDSSEADLWALSMVCQSYLSWKKELISMEEYYEIRDMFVFFGLGITETFATDDELMKKLKESDNHLVKADTNVYIRKIGKLIIDEAPTEDMLKDVFRQIYFNEFDNE